MPRGWFSALVVGATIGAGLFTLGVVFGKLLAAVLAR